MNSLPVVEEILHWVFPLTCYHCEEDLAAFDRGPLCKLCLKEVRPYTGLACKRCQEPLPNGGGHCWRCRRPQKPPSLSLLRAASMYTPPVRSVIRACKYSSRRHLAPLMAAWLAEAMLRYRELGPVDVLVPVPLFPDRERERGFNQALEIAGSLCEITGIEVRDILRRVRSTPPQAKLSRDDRAKNIKGAFKALRGAGLGGKRALLIDDVATTGATLEECARELKKIGLRNVDALVVARQSLVSGTAD